MLSCWVFLRLLFLTAVKMSSNPGHRDLAAFADLALVPKADPDHAVIDELALVPNDDPELALVPKADPELALVPKAKGNDSVFIIENFSTKDQASNRASISLSVFKLEFQMKALSIKSYL